MTAGNASQISDGAVALVLTSAAFAEKHDLKPILRIAGFADAAQSSEKFPTTPSLAIPRAVKNAGKRLEDVDLFEINQAFAVSSARVAWGVTSLAGVSAVFSLLAACGCLLTFADILKSAKMNLIRLKRRLNRVERSLR